MRRYTVRHPFGRTTVWGFGNQWHYIRVAAWGVTRGVLDRAEVACLLWQNRLCNVTPALRATEGGVIRECPVTTLEDWTRRH